MGCLNLRPKKSLWAAAGPESRLPIQDKPRHDRGPEYARCATGPGSNYKYWRALQPVWLRPDQTSVALPQKAPKQVKLKTIPAPGKLYSPYNLGRIRCPGLFPLGIFSL